jgi:hypothetical protein
MVVNTTASARSAFGGLHRRGEACILLTLKRQMLGHLRTAQVRRALANWTPDVEKALADSFPPRRGIDATREIADIVQEFSLKLGCMGGEESMRASGSPNFMEIRDHIVRNFPGFNAECLSLHPGQLRDSPQCQRLLPRPTRMFH